MKYHEPVLFAEVLAHLKVEKGKRYIDATLGDGGHTLGILEKGGVVLGLDVSEESLERARNRIKSEGFEENFTGVLGNFKNIEEVAKREDFSEVNGIIYDLGYSSYQLDESDTGLSFQKDLPLDMRLDSSLGVTAADLVNVLSEKQLTKLIFDYSGEKMAKKFAKEIVKARSLKKIESTKDLSDILVGASSPGYERGRINPSTRTFQALRIAVNDEMANLEKSLPRAARLLLPGGNLLVISFHSLEDELVKSFGRGAQPCINPVNKKPEVPSQKEIGENPRSRSAKLRVFEKKEC